MAWLPVVHPQSVNIALTHLLPAIYIRSNNKETEISRFMKQPACLPCMSAHPFVRPSLRQR